MKIDLKKKLSQWISKRWVKVLLITLAVILVILGIGFAVLNATYSHFVISEDKEAMAAIPVYDRNESKEESEFNLNIAIFGVDKDEMRTDVIFVVNLNTQTDAIKVIAVPRDTKVAWTEFQQAKMEELEKGYYEYSKITEMSAHGGIDNLRYFTINSLEDIMGLHIDHYAVINIDAFRKIVDAIGGVKVEVPRRMEYNDSYQDLHIDLQPGLQTLNGAQAEGLVRWRHNQDYSEQYAEGDVGRIETQQLFLKAFAKKLLSSDTKNNLLKIVNAVYDDLKTDINLNELTQYANYATQFKLDNITFSTLPGEAVRQDKWYYILDQDEVDAFMQKIIYGRAVPIVRDDQEEESDRRRATTPQEYTYEEVEAEYVDEEDEEIPIEELPIEELPIEELPIEELPMEETPQTTEGLEGQEEGTLVGEGITPLPTENAQVPTEMAPAESSAPLLAPTETTPTTNGESGTQEEAAPPAPLESSQPQTPVEQPIQQPTQEQTSQEQTTTFDSADGIEIPLS